jgi:hypothetical protein
MLLQNDTQWSKWLPKIISVYNKTPHASLNNRTPDEVSADVNGMEKRFLQVAKHNQAEDALEAPISVGNTVRILESKKTFAKEGPTFSKELYVVVKKDGFKWRVHPKLEGPCSGESLPIMICSLSTQTLWLPCQINRFGRISMRGSSCIEQGCRGKA